MDVTGPLSRRAWEERVTRLRTSVWEASNFRFLRVFCGGYSNTVKRLRRLSSNSCSELLSLTKDCLLGLDKVSQGFPLDPRPCGEGWGGNLT